MPNPARFWNFIARRYARKPVADEAAYRRKLAMTQAVLPQGAEVLELGCGTGSTALIHAPVVARIDAVDFSERMIDIARGKAAESGVANVAFHRSSVEAFAAPPASYDAVLALSLLHLLEDPEAAVARAYGWLRPGGAFVSGTACLGDVNAAMKAILRLGAALGLLPRLQFLTGAALTEMIVAAGFEIEETWRPSPDKSVFVVARKPRRDGSA